MNKRILLVDDEPNVLNAFKRQLRKRFELDIAEGGPEALEMVNNNDPYAVIVSDMQMPEVNGLQFLCHVREHSPETVRIMLTGNADQKTATDAVNEGRIFRFINKPCSSDELALILTAGLEQHRLITAEQELLSQTLNGSIDLMTDVLSMVNPTAFGRSNRVRNIVKKMCPALELSDSWQVEIAAALSQIGSVTIPSNVLEKSFSGERLDAEEQQMVDQHPSVTAKLVSRIPRLQNVGKIIELATSNEERDYKDLHESVIHASQLLDMILTYDSFACNTSSMKAVSQTASLARFSGRTEWIKALAIIAAEDFNVLTVPISELTSFMILDEDLKTETGLLLVAKGQQLSQSLIERLRNYLGRGISETVRVRCPG